MMLKKLVVSVAALVCVAGLGLAGAQSRTAVSETERVAAFARLYGVVRYFHPSDAAQEIDWPRFAIYGVGRVRQAEGSSDLQRELAALFAPFTTGVEIVPAGKAFAARPPSAPNQPLVAWRHRGLSLDGAGRTGPYLSARTRRETPEPIRGTTRLMQTVDATSLRGRPVRLRATVKATAGDERSGAALWLRVDRAKRQVGFLDEMKDRPIREPEWRDYEVTGTVDEDAETLSLGLMAWGDVVTGIDTVVLDMQNPDGAWEPVKIPDAGFESTQTAWKKSGNSPNAASVRKLEAAPQGKAWMLVQGKTDSNGPFHAPPVPDRFADFDLGAGLRARVPLVLTDAAAKVSAKQRSTLDIFKLLLAEMPDPTASVILLEARQADVVVAWNVYRHFYPYWPDVKTNWDMRLSRLLESVAAGETRAEHLAVLRRLVAEVRDGHGFVVDTLDTAKRGYLPIAIEPVPEGWVVTASMIPEQAQTGDLIDAINGEPLAEYAVRSESMMSGSAQWRSWRAVLELATAPVGTQVSLRLRRNEELVDVQLAYDAPARVTPRRPDAFSEPAPGIYYVDLTRAKLDTLLQQMTPLSQAKAVIFDVRGFLVDSGGAAVLPHLLKIPEQSKWMHVPQYIGPFGQQAGFASSGWNLKPEEPRFAGRAFFLTDGRAISYAESVLSYVADEKLGDIVGVPTAGTNGSTNIFFLPTGYRVTFTGMRVTRHDGSPFHLLGVQPTVPVIPAVESIRAGQDDVLQRALDLASQDARTVN